MFNFLGYYNICHLGDEVREPERVIPRAIIGSILLVLVLDLAISVAFTGVLPWREMIVPGTLIYDAVGSVFMQRAAGFWASQWLTVMVLVTAFASVYSMMLGYSRIPYAAALDGTFFRYFGKTHPRKDFPHRSLLLVGGLSALASLFALVQIITALDPGSHSDHVRGPDHRSAAAQKTPPGSAAPVSHVALSTARVVRDGLLDLYFSGASLRAAGLAIHALGAGGCGKRRRPVPDSCPEATVLAFCALGHAPTRYSFALKVVFSTSNSRDNIVSNMRVNIRARLPHQQASDFRTLPLAVTIENSRGVKANYQHATTAAELLHLLDKRTDLNAAVLDRFREELKFTHAAKLSDIEMSDEVLEAIGFFI